MNFKIIFTSLTLLFLFASCKETNDELFEKGHILYKQKKYDEAIVTFTKIIKRNRRLQLPYYNRGLAYVAVKKYDMALDDFNKVLEVQTYGNFVITYNKNIPFADEETRTQVSYNSALYQRACVKYYMDSLESSSIDFQQLIDGNYEEKSNCSLWQGSIYQSFGKIDKACYYFNKAKELAVTTNDKNDADEMIKNTCGKTNNNR